jgi:hypothetical protein
MMNIKEKTKLLGMVAGLALVPYLITMLWSMDAAEIALKIVNLGLGLH